jgi:hypothetical protein
MLRELMLSGLESLLDCGLLPSLFCRTDCTTTQSENSGFQLPLRQEIGLSKCPPLWEGFYDS